MDGALSEDFWFTSAVAEFGMILRNSEYKGTSTFDSVLELAANSGTSSEKKEFAAIVEKAKKIY